MTQVRHGYTPEGKTFRFGRAKIEEENKEPETGGKIREDSDSKNTDKSS